ncbi:MAG: hypothetical protein ACE5H0_00965, partial [Bacteroidota bacterium]
ELVQSGIVSRVLLVYRQYGQTEFKQREMSLAGTIARTTIPGEEVTPPLLEYFLSLEMEDGSTETYPLESPEANLRQVAVPAVSAKDEEIIVLSPERNQQVSLGEFVLSVSLIRASNKVNKSATRLYLDNNDVTQYAVVLEDLIVFYPENYPAQLRVGWHTVRIDIFDTEGNSYHSVTWKFSVTTAELAAALARNRVDYRLNFQGEARNEEVSRTNTWYNRFTANLNAAYRSARFNGMVFLTSEERGERQPQHRFFANLETNWIRLQAGDTYPKFPSLILRGKRVRGFNGSLMLGFFNLDVTDGEIVRSVEGIVLRDGVPKDSVTTTATFIESSRFPGKFAQINPGKYKRTLFALRPSFGGGEKFQFGLTYLHSEDEVGSIELGLRPKENVVVGPDLLIGFDNQRFLLTAQGAISLVNNDISTGSFNDTQIDSLFGGGNPIADIDANDAKDIRDLVDRFITFNQHLAPINPDEFSSVVGEATISLNYFGNYFKGSYIYRGNEYDSFGQNFLRKDIKGFNILDRLRLAKNRFFITVGYERLEDNLLNTKPATTTFTNTNISLSLYPRTNFPNFTVGYGRYRNDNGLDLSDANAVSDFTNRYFGQLSYNFTAGIRHSVSLNFSTSDRDDETIRKADSKSTTIGGQLNSTWARPLVTSFGITVSQNEVSRANFDYTTVRLSGRYRLLADKLLLSASIAPTFGDFQRQVVEGGLQYFVTRKFSFVFNVRYFSNEEPSSDDIITGLTTRVDL